MIQYYRYVWVKTVFLTKLVVQNLATSNPNAQPVAVHVSQGQKKSCLPQPMEAETDNFWGTNNINMIVNVIHIPMVVGTIPIKSPSVGGFNPSEKIWKSVGMMKESPNIWKNKKGSKPPTKW